ncbi:MAG: hypothetical protein OES09_03955 [Gammaproteobacteria bacterium]|nr:hypothetical protein [Gammaproteobacteria bacterium]
MGTTVENILVLAAALPGVYGFLCWLRRNINAQRAATWVKEHHRTEWNGLHWLAKRNPWAGVEALIKKGLISGPEVNEFRARDEYLEKATWVGLFISALLLLSIIVLKTAIVLLS